MATEPVDNIYSALSRVIGALPGIGKDSKMQGPGASYAYRGIETVTGHAAGLFAKEQIIVIPEVIERELDIVAKTSNGNPIFEARLLVRFTFWHGPSSTSVSGTTWGVGRDSSDKAGNKAMTAAFKYILLQTLMVADKADDPDSERIEGEPEPPSTQRTTVSPKPKNPLLERAKALRAINDKYAQSLRDVAKRREFETANAWIEAEPEAAEALIVSLEEQAEEEASEGQAEPGE